MPNRSADNPHLVDPRMMPLPPRASPMDYHGLEDGRGNPYDNYARTPQAGMRERLLTISGWLMEARPRRQLLDAIMAVWKVGRRMAEKYLRKAQDRMAKQAVDEDRLYYLRLSQLQRDQLMSQVMEQTRDGRGGIDEAKRLAVLVDSASKLMDARDHTALTMNRAIECDPPRTAVTVTNATRPALTQAPALGAGLLTPPHRPTESVADTPRTEPRTPSFADSSQRTEADSDAKPLDGNELG